jgi:hypothetical protein
MKGIMKRNKFLHTLETCWLCLKFPFLYPRNRFTGRHQINVLGKPIWKLKNKSIQEIMITAKLESEETTTKFFNSHQSFLDYHVELKKDEKKLYLWKTGDKVKKEHDLTSILWKEDKFEILGMTLLFSVVGTPIIHINVKTKDENDKSNYGFHMENEKFITDKWDYFWYKVLSFVDEQILDRILFIPTYTELDAMDSGWRKAFGIQMCEEIKAQLKKEKLLYKYRIFQIKKFGMLCWYDAYSSKEIQEIIQKYENLSWNTCVVCGKPATKISGGWICPYCDEHFPVGNIVYQTREGNGEWKTISEQYI